MPYKLKDSPFYRLERKIDLAGLLKTTLDELYVLVAKRDDLYRRRTEELNGKERHISVPVRRLRRLHERLAQLLKRVELPDYVRCPRKGATAWASAMQHRGANFITTYDIKSFHPSTTEEHIFRFWRYELEMSEDCSRLLAILCTDRGFLPFGSPLSAHLACLVHLDVLEGGARLAAETGGKLTAWVDDVTVSGATIRRDVLAKLRSAASRKGLVTHKWTRGGGQRGAEVTGSYLRGKRVDVANKNHLRVRDAGDAFRLAETVSERLKAGRKLLGMLRHQRAVCETAEQDTARLDWRINKVRLALSQLEKAL